jgi:CRISPR/Cas system-associated exonuclease Cas4 (RecB family)
MSSIVKTLNARTQKSKKGFSVAKLEKALQDGYLLMGRESQHRQKKSFAPSSIGYQHGTCPRYWHIAFSGAHFEEKAEAWNVSVMGSGTAAHERIQTALKKSGILESKELEIKSDNPPIFGYIDVVLNIDGERVVGEIKTTGADAFRYRATTGRPAPAHLYQILIYMKLMELDTGFLLYEDRDSLQVAVIVVSMDEVHKEMVDDTFNWMEAVYNNWKAGGEIPKAPWTRRNKACRGCPVFDACWEKKLPVGSDSIKAMDIVKPWEVSE